MNAFIIMRHIGPLSYPVTVTTDIHAASMERQRLDRVLGYAKHSIKIVTMLESKTPASAGVVTSQKQA